MIVSLNAGGMTQRDIGHHLASTIGVELSAETISKIVDEISEEVLAWQRRPLEAFYPAIYLDALVVKVRDGAHVGNKAAHIAVGVDLEGVKHVLGSGCKSMREWSCGPRSSMTGPIGAGLPFITCRWHSGEVDCQRSVVAPSFGVRRSLADDGAGGLLRKPRCRDDVVDPPAAIGVEATSTPGPPGVGAGAVATEPATQIGPRSLVSPGCTEPAVEVLALLGQEARLIAVGPPVLDVDLGVSDIEVTSNDNVSLAPARATSQCSESLVHRVEEAKLLVLLGCFGLTGVYVRGHHGQGPEVAVDVDLDPSTRPGELARTHALADLLVRTASQDRDPVAAQRLRRAVRDVVLRQRRIRQLLVELLVRRANLLQADHISIGRRQPVQSATTYSRADPVDVGGDDSHRVGQAIAFCRLVSIAARNSCVVSHG